MNPLVRPRIEAGRCWLAKPILLLCVFAVILLSSGAADSGERPVVPLVTAEWPPYCGQEPEGQGFVTEIVQSSLKRMGIKSRVDFAEKSWKRCEAQVANGVSWATFPYAITEEREKRFLFSDPVIITCGTRLFAYQKAPDIRTDGRLDLAKLAKLRLGGVAGYFYLDKMAKSEIKFQIFASDSAAIQNLKTKRIDLLPLDHNVGRYLIEKEYPDEADKFVELPDSFGQGKDTELRLMVSKTYPDSANLLLLFNEGLKKIRTEGIYNQILERHGITNHATSNCQ